MECLAEVVSRFAVESSVHGISHILGSFRSWRARLTWTVLCLLAISSFLTFSIWTISCILIKQPVVTNMQYTRHSQMHFPLVLFCPILPNETVFDDFFPESVQDMFSFLTTLSQNRLFDAVRHEARMNTTAVFCSAPNLEKRWQQFFASNNPDLALQTFFG